MDSGFFMQNEPNSGSSRPRQPIPPSNIQSRVPGDQRPTTEFTDTHRKENSDQPCFSVSFRSTNVRPLCAARRLSRQVITTESTEGHRNGNTFGSPFRVVPCFPWLRIFLRLGRAVCSVVTRWRRSFLPEQYHHRRPPALAAFGDFSEDPHSDCGGFPLV